MKILQFFGEPLSYGGQESFILGAYKNFSMNNSYTFCTPFHANNKELLTLIKKRNDNIYVGNKKFESKLRKINIYRTAKIILSSDYDVIHIHSGSILTLLMVSYLAKKSGVKIIIVHSHATGYMTFSHKLIKYISDLFIERYVTYFVACSLDAGLYKYPKNVIKNHKLVIIKNGIDLDKFSFDEVKRISKRNELGIDSKKVLCNVGRFSEEKNHEFIMEIFRKYLKMQDNAILLLVGGSGNTEDSIEKFIKRYQLEEKVIMLKNREDVNELLWASDVFIFPSKFEGLGIAAIEAQASGLPSLVASHLPKELNASRNYYGIDVECGAEKWARKILELKNDKREDCYVELKKSGYDINDTAETLENLYKGMLPDEII